MSYMTTIPINPNAEPIVVEHEEDQDDEKTRVTEARRLFTLAASGDKPSWGHLWMLKKKARYGWPALGFNKREEERIKLNKPDWV